MTRLVRPGTTNIVAVPSNSINCGAIKGSNSLLFENGANYPYTSNFFKTNGQVCGVAMNFYRMTDQGASYSIFQDGGGLVGYCYPADRKNFFCDKSPLGLRKATDDYWCYTYVCGR